MSDPVAEAAAQLAAANNPQVAEPSLLEKAMDTIHELESKVEHLIHPNAEAGGAAPGESVIAPGADGSSQQPESPISNSATAQSEASSSGSASIGSAETADLPNVASVAAEPTTAAASASNADGADITKSTAASSAEPLHVRIAAHLEAIFQMAKDAPVAAVADTSALKTHVGDILHRISNGMAVTEGELVQKLEALYRML